MINFIKQSVLFFPGIKDKVHNQNKNVYAHFPLFVNQPCCCNIFTAIRLAMVSYKLNLPVSKLTLNVPSITSCFDKLLILKYSIEKKKSLKKYI